MNTGKLRTEHVEYIKRWLDRGEKTAIYKCAFCDKDNETIKPQKNMVDKRGYWDSVKICVECSRLNFVKVFPSGKTEVFKLN